MKLYRVLLDLYNFKRELSFIHLGPIEAGFLHLSCDSVLKKLLLLIMSPQAIHLLLFTLIQELPNPFASSSVLQARSILLTLILFSFLGFLLHLLLALIFLPVLRLTEPLVSTICNILLRPASCSSPIQTYTHLEIPNPRLILMQQT